MRRGFHRITGGYHLLADCGRRRGVRDDFQCQRLYGIHSAGAYGHHPCLRARTYVCRHRVIQARQGPGQGSGVPQAQVGPRDVCLYVRQFRHYPGQGDNSSGQGFCVHFSGLAAHHSMLCVLPDDPHFFRRDSCQGREPAEDEYLHPDHYVDGGRREHYVLQGFTEEGRGRCRMAVGNGGRGGDLRHCVACGYVFRQLYGRNEADADRTCYQLPVEHRVRVLPGVGAYQLTGSRGGGYAASCV